MANSLAIVAIVLRGTYFVMDSLIVKMARTNRLDVVDHVGRQRSAAGLLNHENTVY